MRKEQSYLLVDGITAKSSTSRITGLGSEILLHSVEEAPIVVLDPNQTNREREIVSSGII